MNYNKSFVLNPIQKLKEYIEYKAKLNGINYTEIAENYTSGCSALELESLNKDYYNKSRRIVRGLFKAKNTTINSDVNGSLNILRKYLKKKKSKCIPRLITLAMDNGYVNNPKRIRVA
jgi:transposase